MVDKNRNNSTEIDQNLLNKFQNFLDNNIRIIRSAIWLLGGIGVIIIVHRTYALHHFTKSSSIPEIYFKNNVTLAGKVIRIHSNGHLGVQHMPLLWRARINYPSNLDSNLLAINITGVQLHHCAEEFLSKHLMNHDIKFQLLGKDELGNIESSIYQKKGWLRSSCINEDVIRHGLGTAKHVQSLSQVKAYNQLIERLVRAEVKAVKKKSGIWKHDKYDGLMFRTWTWLKNKIFKK